MDRRRKTGSILALTVLLVLLLTGCRVRTTLPGQEVPLSSGGRLPGWTSPSRTEEALFDAAPADGQGERTREDPTAARKEFDENAPAELLPGTDRLLHAPGEGSGAPLENEKAEKKADRLDERAEDTALQTVPAEEAEQKGTSEDAKEADSAMTYYTVLLAERAGSQFECQRIHAYLETEQDHVTVHRSSPEHALLLEAGLYDVSARLLEENLRVDDGWVARKDPGLIVKVVDAGVLGSGVSSPSAAERVLQGLVSRDGWAGIAAVRSGKAVLLSRELLEAPHLRLAAMLLIAKAASPSLYADVDMAEALRRLSEEAAGTQPTGLFFYPEFR